MHVLQNKSWKHEKIIEKKIAKEKFLIIFGVQHMSLSTL